VPGPTPGNKPPTAQREYSSEACRSCRCPVEYWSTSAVLPFYPGRNDARIDPNPALRPFSDTISVGVDELAPAVRERGAISAEGVEMVPRGYEDPSHAGVVLKGRVR
jgi:hypothetical protein